ncbi:MAG: hypothetical protein IPM91_01170 [Bacteroidetes bacterium]|nr:hypothetical protein [Bacteroidota bacterium]
MLSFVPSIVFSQWSAATLSSPRTMLAAASANDVAIIAGGIGLISIPPPASDAYSAVTNNWTGNTLSQGANLVEWCRCRKSNCFCRRSE